MKFDTHITGGIIVKKWVAGFVALMIMAAIAGCGSGADTGNNTTSGTKGDKIVIGMSFPAADHGWMAAVIQNAQDEAKKLGVEVDMTTADSPNKQTNDVEDLITKNVNAILMLPIETDALTPVTAQVKNANIPLVIFDREIANDNYTALVKGDNYGIGKNAGKYISDKLGGKGDVVIISGPPSSVTTLRTNGFMDAIKGTGIKVLANQPGNFQKEKSYQVMQNILQANPHIDAVYTQDDEMALGVLQAIREAKRTDIKIVTGAGGAKDFYKAIQENNDITLATFTYSPLMVKKAVDVAVDIAKGKKVTTKDITLPAEQVDKNNVSKYYDANANY
jgi:ribose transport system substrate-binding protein